MDGKSSLMIALLFALTSGALAATEADDNLHTLAICFLVLCAILFIAAIIVTVILYRRQSQIQRKGYSGSSKHLRYDLSSRQRKISEVQSKDPVGFYGIYNDPQDVSSIYLPLEKRPQTENGTYAHLEGSQKPEESHNYEELKTGKSTLGPTYDNAGAEGDDDVHDYEYADATIVPPRSSRVYENPSDTAF